MKSIVKKSLAVTIVVFMLIMTAIPFVSAATLLDESKKVSFKVSCDKPGYTFEVYEVAKLKNGNSPTFETAYEPLFDGISDEVKSGKTKDILHKLDRQQLGLHHQYYQPRNKSCGRYSRNL